MATHKITHIQIGNETFEIVDAIARDIVTLVYKWGRPGSEARFPNNDVDNAKNKHVIITHILPNTQDYNLLWHSSDCDTEDKWKEIYNYPNDIAASKFNFDNGYEGTILEDFSFAFGQLNIHTMNPTGSFAERNIRHFMLKCEKKNGDQWKDYYNYTPTDELHIKDNGPYGVYNTWAWSTFYTSFAGDVVTTNTYITTEPKDIRGLFGVVSDQKCTKIWGNATTVVFAHSNMPYLGTSDETGDQGTSNSSGN